MRKRLHVVLGGLFVLALLYDFWVWGGLSLHPTFGKPVTDASSRELALATVYVPAGNTLMPLAGLGAAAANHAGALFAPVLPALEANPAAAMETLVEDMPWLARLGYYGAPLLLVAFLLAYWRRPRVVASAFSRR